MIHNVIEKEVRQSRFLPPANEVWGKVIFLHLSVILFHGGGEYLGRYTSWAGTPSQAGTPPGQVHPLAGTPLGRYTPSSPLDRYTCPWAGTPPRQVHPLECILVLIVVAPRAIECENDTFPRLFSVVFVMEKKNVPVLYIHLPLHFQKPSHASYSGFSS